jgi:hypothetical protein
MQILKNLQRIWTDLRDLLGGNKILKETAEAAIVPGQAEVFDLKVLVIVFHPTDPDDQGRKLPEILGWNDVDVLIPEYISDLKKCSHGIANYQVVEKIEVDEFPLKQDGFRYEMKGYRHSLQSRSGFHQPDHVDYESIIDQYHLIERINRKEMDEVWLFGFPYAGFYESRMVGPGSFFCNAPPLDIYNHCLRRFVIMGFNYERGVGEMLESMGHRAEFTMSQVFRNDHRESNLWRKFCRIERTHPGQSQVGTVHFAPNSRRDYDWGNTRPVFSFSDTWFKFPELDGEKRRMDSRDWGNGDIRLHHLWWFAHLPHFNGMSDGISFNWWEYILDPDRIR